MFSQSLDGFTTGPFEDFLHRKKKVREFPVPSRDVTTKLSLGGKLVNLFLRCVSYITLQGIYCRKSLPIYNPYITTFILYFFKTQNPVIAPPWWPPFICSAALSSLRFRSVRPPSTWKTELRQYLCYKITITVLSSRHMSILPDTFTICTSFLHTALILQCCYI